MNKSFLVNFNAIIDLGAGFEAYFASHPDVRNNFPHCNDPRAYRRAAVVSRAMFVGKKTENFNRLLQALSIDVDAAFLEAEYYLTPPGRGRKYEYTNGAYGIVFDFHIDPTAQVETCAIGLSFPAEKEEDFMQLIRALQDDSSYVAKWICNGDLCALNKDLCRTKSGRKPFRAYFASEEGLERGFGIARLIVLAIVALTVILSLFPIRSKINERAARSEANGLIDYIAQGYYETAAAFFCAGHDDGKTFLQFLKETEEETGLDFKNGIEITEWSEYRAYRSDSYFGVPTATVGLNAVIDGKTVALEVGVLANESILECFSLSLEYENETYQYLCHYIK